MSGSHSSWHVTMKFEDFLMQPTEKHCRRMVLEKEVEELQERLNGELKLNSVLSCALSGQVRFCPCISSLPLKVQVLLAELALVEEEISWVESNIVKLKMELYREKQLNQELEIQSKKPHQTPLPCKQQNQEELKYLEWLSAMVSHNRRRILKKGRRSMSSCSALDTQSYHPQIA